MPCNLKGHDLCFTQHSVSTEEATAQDVKKSEFFLESDKQNDSPPGYGRMRHSYSFHFLPAAGSQGPLDWGEKLAEGLGHMSNMGDKAAVEL